MKKLVLFMLALPLVIFIYATCTLYILHKSRGLEFSYENGGTDLSFISSDLGWSAEENMMEGKNYITILNDFESYKLNQNDSSIMLFRTKPKKKFWKWAWWFDNYDSPKWKVPYLTPEELKQLRKEAVKQK